MDPWQFIYNLCCFVGVTSASDLSRSELCKDHGDSSTLTYTVR